MTALGMTITTARWATWCQLQIFNTVIVEKLLD
jgi:hypothetical protein